MLPSRSTATPSAASVEKFTKLLDDPGSLRNKNLVKLVGSPDAIDVNNSYGLLEFRHAEQKHRRSGGRTRGPSALDDEDREHFADVLERILSER